MVALHRHFVASTALRHLRYAVMCMPQPEVVTHLVRQCAVVIWGQLSEIHHDTALSGRAGGVPGETAV